MNILVINCGSSSLKYQLINSETEEVLAKGICERIGIEGSVLVHQPAGKDKIRKEAFMENHTLAVKMVIDALIDDGYPEKKIEIINEFYRVSLELMELKIKMTKEGEPNGTAV